VNWHVGWRWVGGSVQGEVMMERSHVGVIQYAWGRRCISRCLSGYHIQQQLSHGVYTNLQV